MQKKVIWVGIAVFALGGLLWAGARKSLPKQPERQHVMPPPLPKPAPDASTIFSSAASGDQNNDPSSSIPAPSEHATEDPFQQGNGTIGVKDAYNAVQMGMDRDDVLNLLSTPSVSKQIARPSFSGGTHTNADSPNLPAGRKDSGGILDMEYQYPDGKLMIYLAGTPDSSHKQTGGKGTEFIVYKFWIVR